MRIFELHRDVDETGISGTGRVAEAIEFSDGFVALRWMVGDHQSTVVWPNIAAVEAIHGHDGKSRLVEIDSPDRGYIKNGFDVHTDGSAVWVECRGCRTIVGEDWSLPSDLDWLWVRATRHECGGDEAA